MITGYRTDREELENAVREGLKTERERERKKSVMGDGKRPEIAIVGNCPIS